MKKSALRFILSLPFLISFCFSIILISCGSAPVKNNSAGNAPLDAESGIKTVTSFPFYVYKDSYSKLNHFFSTGWMGDVYDMTYNDAWPVNPKSGKSCFRIRYSAKGSRGFGWAGLYWQDPANNWNVGQPKGGYNLTGARKLKFFARGENGGEMVEFQAGGISSEVRSSSVIELSREWLLYEIDLQGMNLSLVNGGFNAIYTKDNNPGGCVFYIDEVYYTDKD